MRSNTEKFTPDQTAIIDEWCRKYPKGKGVDMKRIKAEDWGRLESLKQETGRNDHGIYCKAAYHRMHVIKDVAKKPSVVRQKPHDPGPYECPKCDATFATKQGLGGHMHSHKEGKRSNHVIRTMPLAVPQITDEFVTVSVPMSMVGQPLNDCMIVSIPGSYRLAKLV